MIAAAVLSDALVLSTVALTSKAYWGYSEAQIKDWKDDLAVTSTMITEMKVYKFLHEDVIAGFYILNKPKLASIELEFLFVLPEFIGKGIGKSLLHHAIKEAKSLQSTIITVLADPNATAFYESQGFKVVEKKESSIPNRFLPVMVKDLCQ